MNPQRTASAESIGSIQPPLNQGGTRPEIMPDIELPRTSPDRAEVIPLLGETPVSGLVGRPGFEPGSICRTLCIGPYGGRRQSPRRPCALFQVLFCAIGMRSKIYSPLFAVCHRSLCSHRPSSPSHA